MIPLGTLLLPPVTNKFIELLVGAKKAAILDLAYIFRQACTSISLRLTVVLHWGIVY